MRKRILLGTTKDNELVFIEYELRNGPAFCDRDFTASFDLVAPFDDDTIDEEYVRTYLEDFDKETLYDLCVTYDCTPNDLPYEYYSRNEIEDIVDCSLYPEAMEVNGKSYHFRSEACGQVDVLELMKTYTDEGMFCELYGLWHHFHLKSLNTSTFAFINDTLKRIEAKNEKFDDNEFIRKFIKSLQQEGK